MSTRTDLAAYPSLENYVQFLGFFRGTVRDAATSITIESDRPQYTMTIPLEPDANGGLDRAEGSILALPWIAGLDDRLSKLSRRKQAEIVFMSKPIATAAGEPLGVRVARAPQEVDDFSLVQSRAFLEDEVDFQEWYPWLRSANLRNVGNERCHFLVADVEGRPASVTLLVESPRACGIYAVGTPPEYRRKGLGKTLLSASDAMARSRGYDTICLQVYAGTYAHGFYDRLGFVEEYRAGVWM